METEKNITKIDRQINRIFRVTHLVLRYLIALFLIFQFPYLHHRIATTIYKINELYLTYSAWGALLGLFIFYSTELERLYVLYNDYMTRRQDNKKEQIINEYKVNNECQKTQE